MNRKMALILGIVAVIFVAALSIGVISAANSHEVTIMGEKFNIPDGYRETDTPLSSVDSEAKEYKNNAGDFIMINVHKSPGQVVDLGMSEGDVKKTIAGFEGNYNDKDTMFTYTDGNNVISIQASDEQMIEKIITGNF